MSSIYEEHKDEDGYVAFISRNGRLKVWTCD